MTGTIRSAAATGTLARCGLLTFLLFALPVRIMAGDTFTLRLLCGCSRFAILPPVTSKTIVFELGREGKTR